MKQYFKRLFQFIIHGIPQKNIRVNVVKVAKGDILNKRNILITGGGSGIGLAIAKYCAEEGANVIIIGRNEEKLRDAASNISGCKFLSFDLNKIDQIH